MFSNTSGHEHEVEIRLANSKGHDMTVALATAISGLTALMAARLSSEGGRW